MHQLLDAHVFRNGFTICYHDIPDAHAVQGILDDETPVAVECCVIEEPADKIIQTPFRVSPETMSRMPQSMRSAATTFPVKAAMRVAREKFPVKPQMWEVGDVLLSSLEPRSKTGSLSTSVDPSDRERLAFFRQKGYRPESSLYQMIADLDRRRRRPHLPGGCVIRNLRTDQEKRLIELANTAYDGERLRPGILALMARTGPEFQHRLGPGRRM